MTHGRRPALAVATLALTSALSGCAAFSDDTAADDGQLTVAAAFYPLQYAAQRVAGDLAVVEVLSKPGQDPHDLEMTIAEATEVSDADLVIHQSGFQPSVDAAVEQNATGEVLDAADVVDLREAAHGEHAEETAEEHAEHAGEGGEDHDHDHGDLDPHFWQDPLRMAALGDAVAADLADLDPDHAEEFTANAAALRSDLEALDASYAEGLASCARTTVVVSHDAFSYLDKYGLDMEPIAGLSPEAEPTPADLARLQQLIRSDGITTVFSERLAPPQLTESLARDAGVGTAVLDTVEGLTDEDAGDDYLSLMEQNLTALEAANGC